MRGHAACVDFVKSFNLPLLMLGGGGYTVKSVSRTWAYETGLAAGQMLQGSIPNNEYYEYYGPDYELDVKPSNMTDHNTPEYLEKLREAVFEVLRDKNAAPSVQIHGEQGCSPLIDRGGLRLQRSRSWRTTTRMRMKTKIERTRIREYQVSCVDQTHSGCADGPVRLWDKTKQHETSLSDSEDEGTGGRRHAQSHRDSNGTAKKGRRSRSPRSASANARNSNTPASTVPITPSTAAPVAATPAPGTTIDSGLLDNPPTAPGLRTTRPEEPSTDGDVIMAEEAGPPS
jgi:histone deacetylase 1/2